VAGVWQAPVVFLVQNNGYAISVPLAKQTAARRLADRGAGFGVRAVVVDGNDAAAVHAVVREAVEHAAAGGGPTLIEALTSRIEAHTNADDATRYRPGDEVAEWLARDPIDRLEVYLRAEGLLDDARAGAVREEAEEFAAAVRERLNADLDVDAAQMFAHVYARPTAALAAQGAALEEELTS
jgi:pyruvate dehydrogenase E1 component alpha subunit